MVRRAVFALILIGAAFAGGAAINGPGLAWLQRNFAGGLLVRKARCVHQNQGIDQLRMAQRSDSRSSVKILTTVGGSGSFAARQPASR